LEPWVKTLAIVSGVFFAIVLYVTSWTSTGPSLFPIEWSSPETIAYFQSGPLDAGPRFRLPPEWLHTPTNAFELVVPLSLVILICLSTRLIPRNNGTRLVVRALTVALATRYMLWRTWGSTLNLTNGISTALSLWMYGIEIFSYIGLIFYCGQTIWSSAPKRHAQADRYEAQIRAGEYLPSVDIYVPTYNEPEDILRRTVIGCQRLDYPNKKVYICDDGDRPNIKALANALGCGYLVHPPGVKNRHAKAGNINNAMTQTDGELLVVMDADFVPFNHFLLRTVGFFQDPQVAIVQTPQDFYNPDHHVRNLGLGDRFPNDLQQFFHHDQATRDAANSAMCCGTSYVIRRKSLEAIGGYYLRCVNEDSPTSTLLLTRGYRVVFLPEMLSMGESTRNYRDFIKQRLRWLQGNLQIFFCGQEVPIWRTLNWVQRTYMLTHLTGCFQPLTRLTYLFSPMVCLYLGVSNYIATFEECVYYIAPFLLLIMGTFSWASGYNTSFFYSEICETMFCFPGIQRLFSTLLQPFRNSKFNVTPKGVTEDQKIYNWEFTWPLLVGVALTVCMFGFKLGGYHLGYWEVGASKEFGLVSFWMIYNALLMAIASMAAIDQPERRRNDRFPTCLACELSPRFARALTVAGKADSNETGKADSKGMSHVGLPGYTLDLSETGASVVLPKTAAGPDLAFDSPVQIRPSADPLAAYPITLSLAEHGLQLNAAVLSQRSYQDSQCGPSQLLQLQFEPLALDQERRLVDLLYCHSSDWKQPRRLGALDSLLSLLSSAIALRSLRNP
jgi:cellulose synthase (UDP-forming)